MLGRSSQRCGAALGVAGPDNKALVSKEMICIFSPMGPKPESPRRLSGVAPIPTPSRGAGAKRGELSPVPDA